MYKSIFTILLLANSVFSFAQSGNSTSVKSSKSNFGSPSRDYVMLQAGYDTWLNVPDSIKLGGIGRFFNAYICYDNPIQKSNFSFAAGVGIGTSNIYLKNQVVQMSDSSIQISFLPEGAVDYKKYKLTTAYIEAPFELRYFTNKENRNKGFKASVGLRVGTLVSAHTKGKYTFQNKPISDKVVTKRYFENWRYALTMRAGYGNFSVFGAYQISNVFRLNNGPENIRPIQIGVCLSGL